ncbi:MAG: hypothetical protein RL615_138, partial [Pseudomonadota bacterium]
QISVFFTHCTFPFYLARKHYSEDNSLQPYNLRDATVVQWIELEFPKLSIQVRFLSVAPDPQIPQLDLDQAQIKKNI